MSALKLIKMVVVMDSDNTGHWCDDCWVQTVGYFAVDEVLIMRDGVDIHKQSSMQFATEELHSLICLKSRSLEVSKK
jgi:hypothetical protein